MENTENTGTQNPVTPNPQDDKTICILSYLIWIVAYIMYGSKKTEYNTFHIRQGLGLFIIWVAAIIGFSIVLVIVAFIPMIWGLVHFVSYIVYLALTVLAILGILNANAGTQKELPVIGKFISNTLKNFK
jgi:uncharacterized membrane protein